MKVSEENTVVVRELFKTFKLPHEQHSGIKQRIINIFKGVKGYETLKVLNDISFEIKKGEFFGIVGRNGSGKSTLLKILAGVYVPDKGLVQINGSLTPFIELGVGFNSELTGRENVFLNGALLGFSKTEMEAMYNTIVEFAEIEDFMDQKLKNYSSGMQVRLAFSIAIRAKSDILLIDEVLAVGDAAFQSKCFDYFYELKKSDTTVIFVSHDQGSLERFCDRGILINDGKIITYGKIKNVLKSYRGIVLEELEGSNPTAKIDEEKDKIEYANISDTVATDINGKKSTKFSYQDDININFNINVTRDIENPVFGVTIWQKNIKRAVLATNTNIDNYKNTGIFKKGDVIKFNVKLPKNLNSGEYRVEPAITNDSTTVFYDQQPDALKFNIDGGDNPHSIISFDKKSVYTVDRFLNKK